MYVCLLIYLTNALVPLRPATGKRSSWTFVDPGSRPSVPTRLGKTVFVGPGSRPSVPTRSGWPVFVSPGPGPPFRSAAGGQSSWAVWRLSSASWSADAAFLRPVGAPIPGSGQPISLNLE